MLLIRIPLGRRQVPESFSKASFPLAAVITSHPRSSSMDAVDFSHERFIIDNKDYAGQMATPKKALGDYSTAWGSWLFRR